MPDSSLVSVRMADNRRLCVATPAYLKRHGTPQTPADLVAFPLPDLVQRRLPNPGLGLQRCASDGGAR